MKEPAITTPPLELRSGLRVWIRRFDLRAGPVLLTVALSLTSALFDGLSVGILVPLLHTILGDANTDGTVLAALAAWLPETWDATTRMIALALCAFAAAVIQQGLRYAAGATNVSLSVRAVNSLRKRIFTRIFGYGRLFFDQASAGTLSSLVLRHCNQLAQAVREGQNAFQNGAVLVVYIGLMFVVSWQLSLGVLACAPPLLLFVRWLLKRVERRANAGFASDTSLDRHLANTLQCVGLIKENAREPAEVERFAALSDEETRRHAATLRAATLVDPAQRVAMLFLVLGAVIGVAFAIRAALISPAGLLVFAFLVREIMTKTTTLSRFRTRLATFKAAAAAIDDVLDPRDKPVVADGTEDFPGLRQEIALVDLRFTYPRGTVALEGVSLTVPRGSVTAVVGQTGAGKTTLLRLLTRGYECPPGSILLDGRDIRSFRRASLLRAVAVVSQDCVLLHDSLRVNLTYGLGEISDEALWKALRQARLAELVRSLPAGLETRVGDRGVMLSGGERQRVSLARALLKNAEILLLDEATSFLDPVTERQVQLALEEARRGRTTIAVAHRLATIRHADQVCVLERGRLLEKGRIPDLLAAGGRFRELWDEAGLPLVGIEAAQEAETP